VRFVLIIFLVAIQAAGSEPPADGWRLTDQEKRGRQIYMQGSSPSGPEILALLGDPPAQVSATLLSCANCHGHDGAGRPEGGVSPPDITRLALSRSYSTDSSNGRARPGYTNANQLIRAITMGVDPKGNKLAYAMPRFLLSYDQAQDLAAFLGRLGEIRDPGITPASLRLGVLLPNPDTSPALDEVVRTVLQGFFADLNRESRIYNRQIELSFAWAGKTPTETEQNLRRLIEQDEVFALIGCFSDGIEDSLASLSLAERIPVVGTLTEIPDADSDPHRYLFQLWGGLTHQTCAMIRFALLNYDKSAGPASVAILSWRNSKHAEIAAATAEYCRGRYKSAVEHYHDSSLEFDARAWVKVLKDKNVRIVTLLGSAEEQALFLEQAAAQQWAPVILIPGPLLGKKVVDAANFKGMVLTSLRHIPGRESSTAILEFQEFVARHQIPPHHRETQVTLHSVARIMTEGLKRAGQELDREKLIAALEQLRNYDTGLTPLISFGPARRVGTRGAYVAAVGLQTRKITPVSNWIEQ
jgi:ABC-type branched-subunit amino acid transport system substrate-binding protein